jgi:ketosteroid isomerase-like protein
VDLVTRLHPGRNTDLVALSKDANAWAAVTANLEAFFEPDFELEVVNPFEGPTVAKGFSGIREFWTEWLAPWQTYHDELEQAIDLDDKVLLLGRHRGIREQTDHEVSARLAALYTLRDGKVTRIQYYTSHDDALKALGLEE